MSWISGKDWQELNSFEREGSDLLQEAIDAAVEAFEIRAREKYIGRMISWKHWWSSGEDAVNLSAPISDIMVEVGGGFNLHINLRWKVKVRDPRNGHNVTLDLNPECCQFI